jgi:hypothetical protein
VSSPLLEKIEEINAQIGALLAHAQRALTGSAEFGVEQVRALTKPIAEMAPIMEHASELRTLQPEIVGELDLYKSQLRELQTTLERVHMMLLARQSQIQAGQVQLDAVSQWATALGRTR